MAGLLACSRKDTFPNDRLSGFNSGLQSKQLSSLRMIELTAARLPGIFTRFPGIVLTVSYDCEKDKAMPLVPQRYVFSMIKAYTRVTFLGQISKISPRAQKVLVWILPVTQQNPTATQHFQKQTQRFRQ